MKVAKTTAEMADKVYHLSEAERIQFMMILLERVTLHRHADSLMHAGREITQRGLRLSPSDE